MSTRSVLDHLTAARMSIETGDDTAAVEHIRAATALLTSDGELCDATKSAGEDPNHYLHSPSRTFGHVCTGIEGHDAPHLCACGATWTERMA